MPIVNTSDGYYAVFGARSQGPFADPRQASVAELQMSQEGAGQANIGPGGPQFPTVRLGPGRTPMKVTPAVLPAQPTGPMQASIGDAAIESQGDDEAVDAAGHRITIGDAVIELAPQARRPPGSNPRLLPKKKGTRP